MRNTNTYGDLFESVANYCDFQEDASGNITWKCDGTLREVNKFCSEHRLSKLETMCVIAKLEANGAFCDCEVLFNAVENIDESTIIGGE